MGKANRNYAWRRYQRHVHGMRRLRLDRSQHGDSRWCDCFSGQASHGRGIVFDRFADHPAVCSCSGCGNRRKWDGPTRRERMTD